MLKSSATLLDADPRFRDLISHNAATGEIRPMRIDDLRELVHPIELSQNVPATIREQFDIARNAFVYSWFVYEFATLAEQQCYFVLEMALRDRIAPAPPNTSKSPGLGKLLKAATEQGFLQRKDFEMPSISGSGETAYILDLIPMFRNHLMHGNIHLLPQQTPDVIKLCAEILNRLFAARS
jgi:hypothetical protein